MKRQLLPLLLLPVVFSFGLFYKGSNTNPNRLKEKHLIDSVFFSLNCNCLSPASNEKQIRNTNEDGVLILYKKERIMKKGCFRNYVLECGVECEYDYGSDTSLVLIRKIIEGKFAGEVKVR